MITLNDGQRQIASRASAQIVMLVKLDTFTDHAAETVDETFWWASTPISYKWDGSTVEQFKGVLTAVSPISRGFSHIPNANELSTRDGLTLDLDASKWADEFPWERLISKNLIGAHIEVASLLVDWGDPLPDDWKDQTSLGAVHTVRFRGEVTDVPEYDDEANRFSIVCDSIEVPLPWAVALDPLEVSNKDLGKVYPIPVGQPKRIPLVQRQVGWVTTLGSDITESTTGFIFATDTTGFPDDPTVISIFIGTEKITATKNNDQSLLIVARGQSSGALATVAQNHQAGAVMIEEIPAARFVYSGVETLGLTALYARSPQSGELVFIPAGGYGVEISNKTLDTGEALGVVSFTPQEWAGLIRLLNNEASVTVQPVVTQVGVETLFIQFGSIETIASIAGSVDCDVRQPVNDGTGAVMDIDASANPKNATKFTQPAGTVPNQTRVVSRFRPVFDYRIEAAAAFATRMFYELAAMGQTQGKTLIESFDPGFDTQKFATAAGAWETPTGGTTLAALVGATCHVYMDNSLGGVSAKTELFINISSRWEIELVPNAINTTQNTETTGAQEIGFNLDLFADVLGAVTLGTETSLTLLDDKSGWTFEGQTAVDIGGGGGFTVTGNDPGTSVFRIAKAASISPVINLSSSRLKFDVKITQVTWDFLVHDTGALVILLADTGSEFAFWGWPKTVMIPDVWTEFTFDKSGAGTQFISGSGSQVDFANIDEIWLQWQMPDIALGGSISYRNLRVEARTFPQHPVDVAQWLIEENAGITGGADSGTFATAKTNLPGVVLAGDLRQAGANIGEVLARIGFESRTNFYTSEATAGTVFKASNALATYDFTASARTLSEFNRLRTKPKQLDEQATEFIGFFDFRNQFDQSDVQGYAALIQANETTNDVVADVSTSDITDAQDRIGIRAAEPLSFFLIPDLAGMVEVFAYYVQEALRGASIRYTMNVPYSLGYDLEQGDIVQFTPRWKSSPVKCRIVRINYPPDAPSVGLNLEEVL